MVFDPPRFQKLARGKEQTHVQEIQKRYRANFGKSGLAYFLCLDFFFNHHGHARITLRLIRMTTSISGERKEFVPEVFLYPPVRRQRERPGSRASAPAGGPWARSQLTPPVL
jgi:hypothetical protein